MLDYLLCTFTNYSKSNMQLLPKS